MELLTARGIAAVIEDDSAPGVPEGTFQVSVPKTDAAQAEKLIAENPLPDEAEAGDNSDHLNLETIYHAEGSGRWRNSKPWASRICWKRTASRPSW